jgi:ferrous iron transport protein A
MSDSKLMTKRLSELKPGESGIIVSFDDDENFLRLMEMGFIIGEKVEVVQLAPLGDPMMVTVFGYQVSLRINEAERVVIECIVNED